MDFEVGLRRNIISLCCFFDQCQFVESEVRIFRRFDVIKDLLQAGSFHQHTDHDAITQDLGQRHLRQGLNAPCCQVVQRSDLVQLLYRQSISLQEPAIGHDPAIGGDALEIAACQQSLGQRQEGNDSFAQLDYGLLQAIFSIIRSKME